MDTDFNGTNTSAYNIYSKCYKNVTDNTIDMGCEDETGPTQYLNDVDFKKNWNIKDIEGLEWKPCSIKIWNSFIDGNGTYHLLHKLIKDNIRIVYNILILVGLFR